MGRKVKLPSGAELDVTPADFAVSKALYMAMCKAGIGLRMDLNSELDVNFWKDVFFTGFSDAKIEAAISACMTRVTYQPSGSDVAMKIDKDTWEPIPAREDYIDACFEVARDNVLPFTKNLYARYLGIVTILTSTLPSRSPTTTS